MGKVGEEQPIPTSISAQNTDQNAHNCCRIRRIVGVRCVFALFLGIAVFLSAVFWLPPFFGHGDQGNLDLDSQFRGHDIVATFDVGKPVSVLENNMMQLQDDIFDEIGFPDTKVEIISMEPYGGSNVTKVIFAVDPDVKGSKLTSAAISVIRSSFVYLVINQSSLQLTTSLFGDPSSFDVLKFAGGITVSPPQSAYLLQKAQIRFNFTLNFSIDQIQDNFIELTSQLKSGLHLAPYENLYISLTNHKGSTVGSPTTVQSSVVLAVGNTLSTGRLKQLAQTITGSPTKNLGLNNTVFGKVKQVSLSSILHGGDGSPSPSPTPLPLPHHQQQQQHHHHHHHHHHHSSPAPVPEPDHHHHHHHHQHRHHHDDVNVSPAPSPMKGQSTTGPPAYAPVPAPVNKKTHLASPPGCHNRYRNRSRRKANKHGHLISPAAAPPVSEHHIAPSPQPQLKPHAHVHHLRPSSSPLPHVVYSHKYPPPTGVLDAKPPDLPPSLSPSQPSSFAGSGPSHNWWILPAMVFVLHL